MRSPNEFVPSALVAGRYRLIRRIDAGGMGEVFEAEQLSTHRRVALKLMRNATDRRSARRRFEREAEHLGRLHHANIAEVFDAGEHDADVTTVPFIAMELVDRGIAITRWANEQALSIRERLTLVAIACDALQHAHAKEVIHQDLKPANLLVDAAGNVKLIDFGLSQILRPIANGDVAAGETMYSDASVLYGTPQYMSPERFQQRVWLDDGSESQRAATIADDVYAVGVILYELCAGRVPFDLSRRGPAEVAIFSRIVAEHQAQALSSENNEISADLDTVILRCLAKEPQRRYPSAAAIAKDLRRVISGQPIEAKRDTRAYGMMVTARNAIRRHPLITTAAAAVIAAAASHAIGDRIDGAVRPHFERLVMTNPHLQHFDANRDLSHVRLIAITPDADYGAIAKRYLLPTLENNPKALRALHGLLMQRLAKANCNIRSLGWDVYFAGDASVPIIDERFAAGARSLKACGIPVVVASSGWDMSANSKTISDAVITGAATAITEPDAPWSIQASRMRFGEPLPPSLNLAVAATAALRSSRPFQLEILNGAIGVQSTSGRVEFPIMLGQVGESDAAHDVKTSDVIVHSFIELPSDRSLSAATIRYADVLTASDAELQSWFKDKAVIVGDQRPNTDPVFHYFDGRDVVGAYAQLTAVEQFLENRSIRYMPLLQIGSAYIDSRYILESLLALISVTIGIKLARRNAARMIVVALILGSITLGTLLAYRLAGILYSPVVSLLSVLVVAEAVSAAWRFCKPHISFGVRF